MRPVFFILAAGVCLGGLGLDPDGKPAASLPEAVAKPVAYEPPQVSPPAAPEFPDDALPTPAPVTIPEIHPQPPRPQVKVLPASAPPRGYICGPSGCYPAAATPRAATIRQSRTVGRWYPGKRIGGWLRGRRR